MIASIFLIGCLLLGLILMLFVQEDLRRYTSSILMKMVKMQIATTGDKVISYELLLLLLKL